MTIAGVAFGELLDPSAVFDRDQVLHRPSPVPRMPGVYAWYFDSVPPGVPTDSCHVIDGLPLLYVGISPKAPPGNGSAPSRQTIRSNRS